MTTLQALRGTRDILPDEIAYWQLVETTARDILTRANYQEIRTPIFEQTELFQRGIGEATDVVGKEMYSFSDRGDRSLTLRPEGTAGVVRAYIEHNLFAAGGVQRLWYTGPMFRYERPQAGRQRQFHQIGLELLGTDAPRADAEVIALASDILQALGLKNLHLAINSVGQGDDRDRYRQALIDYFSPYQDEIDADSRDRLSRNPLRILDSKDERTQAIAQNAPSILDYLSDDSKRHFDRVCALLEQLSIPYDLNPRLVRGLDYYTHTAFEIQSDDLGGPGHRLRRRTLRRLSGTTRRKTHPRRRLGHWLRTPHSPTPTASRQPQPPSRLLCRLPRGTSRSPSPLSNPTITSSEPRRGTRLKWKCLWQTVQTGFSQWGKGVFSLRRCRGRRGND